MRSLHSACGMREEPFGALPDYCLEGKDHVQMNRWLRAAGRGLCALLTVFTLAAQSVLPALADTADTQSEASGTGYTVAEEEKFFALGYFDRIAVNSVRGIVTIRPGDDFTISFPEGWDQVPSVTVQDEILVVSGRRSAERAGKSTENSVVVLGEDEPAESGIGASGPAQFGTGEGEPAQSGADEGEPAQDGAAESSDDAQEAEPSGAESSEAGASEAGGSEAEQETEFSEVVHEVESSEAVPRIVITIPSGIGLDTLRIAMEKGDLIMTDITANSVTIQSGGGSLIMKDVSLGSVDIYAESGKLSMTESAFKSLNIGMAQGDVAITSKESLVRCRMELGTGDGEVRYNGSSKGGQYMQPGNDKKFLKIQVGSGDISIN